jgi:response regulator RpfG family c-di-GMP phosphodiesterase
MRTMNGRILCVDDDENILASYQRQLRKQFQIQTALGAEAGLQMVSSERPFAVVVSDLRMPGMGGIEFLSRIRQMTPDTVRIMLTGNADLRAAVEAVNEGNIFRFLTKPCNPEVFAQALQAGLQQYRLVTAEKELLEQTLKGSIGVLTEILSILDQQSFGRVCTLRDMALAIAKALGMPDTWDLELAAMLCEIGRVTIPASTIIREKSGVILSTVEKDMLSSVPEIGHRLLTKIPRLESVAEMVLYQRKNFDGSGFPKDRIAGKQIPLGSRILKLVTDLTHHESAGRSRDKAFAILEFQEGIYDPEILECAARCLAVPADSVSPVQKSIRSVSIAELEVGHILLSDIVASTGALVIASGNVVSESLRQKIRNFARLQSVREPIRVRIINNSQ